MATAPQILANRANAQLSTGPKTDAEKAAVLRNAASHSPLSSGLVTLLPHENPEEFQQLLESLNQQFEPASAAEDFLITEMARPNGNSTGSTPSRRASSTEPQPATPIIRGAVARGFQGQTGDALVKLDRYAAVARCAWHKSLDTLLRLRASRTLADERVSRSPNAKQSQCPRT